MYSTECMRKGFRAENDERFLTDPYAETTMRLANYLAKGANEVSIPEKKTIVMVGCLLV